MFDRDRMHAAGMLTDDKLRIQKDNLLDANEPRPARVWENDPADLTLSIDGQRLAHQKWLLKSKPGDEARLLQHIRDWIKTNKVGSEFGVHKADKLNSNNTVSKKHLPNTGDVDYWVYGQNCGWWSSEVTSDIGLWPSFEQRKAIKE